MLLERKSSTFSQLHSYLLTIQMDSMAAIFAPALQKYTTQLLARISLEYNLPSEDLVTRYLSSGTIPKIKTIRKPKEPTAERPMCPFLCGTKKTSCKNRCVANGTGCHLHDPAKVLIAAQTPKPPKAPKPPKVLKGESLGDAPAPVPVPVPVSASLALAAARLALAAAEAAAEAEAQAPPAPTEPEDNEETEDELEEEPLGEMSVQDRLRAMLAEEDEEQEDEEQEDEFGDEEEETYEDLE